MRRENPRWEYRRETSAYDKSDYRSKFYKGKWEKAWIKNRIQYALDKNGSPRAEFFTDEDRRAMRIRIPIHPAFLEADDEVLLPDSYEKATKKSSKKKIEQYEKILKLLNDGEWHKTAEIADNLGLKDTRTKELLKELIALDKLIDNGKTKGKLYRLK